jgi:peptide/nickel transport system substrate-binding protein
MVKNRAISKTATLAILVVAVLLVVGGIAAYYMTAAGPQPPTVKRIKETLIIGTTDSVQTTLDPAEAYDYLGVNIIQNLGEGLFAYEPSTTRIVNDQLGQESMGN